MVSPLRFKCTLLQDLYQLVGLFFFFFRSWEEYPAARQPRVPVEIWAVNLWFLVVLLGRWEIDWKSWFRRLQPDIEGIWNNKKIWEVLTTWIR